MKRGINAKKYFKKWAKSIKIKGQKSILKNAMGLRCMRG